MTFTGHCQEVAGIYHQGIHKQAADSVQLATMTASHLLITLWEYSKSFVINYTSGCRGRVEGAASSSLRIKKCQIKILPYVKTCIFKNFWCSMPPSPMPPHPDLHKSSWRLPTPTFINSWICSCYRNNK